MNKDLERARREADRKETEKIMKAINEQCKRKQKERLLQEQIDKIAKEKKEKKEKTVDFIQVVVLFMFLMALVVTMLTLLYKDGEKHIKECTAMGYSEEYCISEL